MVSQNPPQTQSEVIYLENRGKTMANNTIQHRWIVEIRQNLDWLFAEDPNVFVAENLLWYPVSGRSAIVNAPDVMIVFGRPKGERRSYQQYQEAEISPQVVFTVVSPSKTQDEMDKKLLFYERYGVEEYYIYDPDKNSLRGWLRNEDGLDIIPQIENWVSPRLKICFVPSSEGLQLYRPDGVSFQTYTEIFQELEQERQRAEQAEKAIKDVIPRLSQMGLLEGNIAQALGLSVQQ